MDVSVRPRSAGVPRSLTKPGINTLNDVPLDNSSGYQVFSW